MSFHTIPGFEGQVFQPDEPEPEKKKHNCPDCYSCQWCDDDRCRICLGCVPCPDRSVAE